MATVLTAVVRKDGAWYVADCPEVGTVRQGKRIEEAVANLKEATELYLAEFPQSDFAQPVVKTFEVVHA